MRKCLVLAVAVGLLAVARLPAPAADDDACRAVVDRAIAAAGGAERLGGLKAAVWKTKGTFGGRPSAATLSGKLPDCFRLDSEGPGPDGKPVRFTRVLNGGQGWTERGGKTEAMTPDAVAAMRATFEEKRLATTLVPLRDPANKLAPLGEAAVGDRKALGVRVTAEGRPEMRLYFDRETGHLLRCETTARDPRAGKDVTRDLLFSNHRRFGGLVLPGKTVTKVDGKVVSDIDTVEFKAVDGLPDELFRKP
jgi:hypothetical protein